MRKVIYAIVIIIVLIIIFLLASPVYYGKRTKQFMQQAINRANEQYASYRVQAHLLSFKRRWYSSDAVIEVSVNNLAFKKFYKKYIDPQFNLRQPFTYKEIMVVKHGPVIYHGPNGMSFSAASIMGYAQMPAALKQKLHLTLPLLEFNGTVSYRGAFCGNIIVAPVHYHSVQAKLDWQGMAFHGLIGAALSNIKGNYVNQPIELKIFANQSTALQQDMLISLAPSKTQINMQRHAGDLWTGHFSTFIPEEKVLIYDHSKKRNAITESHYKDVSNKVALSLNNNQYNVNYQFAIKSLLMGGKYHARNVNLHLQLQALNADALAVLQKMAVKELSVQGKPAEDSFLDALNQQAVKLITPKTKVILKNFSVDLPQGDVVMSSAFSWPHAKPSQTLTMLMLGVKIESKIKLAKSLVDYVVEQVDAAAKQDQTKPVAKPLPLEPGPVITGSHHMHHAKPAVKPQQPAAAHYKAYADQAQGMLQALVAEGYIDLKDGYYSTNVNYQLGQVMANGKKVRL